MSTQKPPTQEQIAEHLFLSKRHVGRLQAIDVLDKGATLDEARKGYIRHLQRLAASGAAAYEAKQAARRRPFDFKLDLSSFDSPEDDDLLELDLLDI